jgi:hypothetical protein
MGWGVRGHHQDLQTVQKNRGEPVPTVPNLERITVCRAPRYTLHSHGYEFLEPESLKTTLLDGLVCFDSNFSVLKQVEVASSQF